MLRYRLHSAFLSGALVGLVYLTTAKPALAQATSQAPATAPPTTPPAAAVTQEPKPATEVAAPAAAGKSEATSATPQAEPPKDPLAALEQKVSAQASRIDELQTKLDTMNEQLSATDNGSDSTEDRRLTAWGFFDVTFGRFYYDNSQAAFAVAAPTHSSFLSNGINLYLKSEMTKTLSAMVETRLTYTPVGNVPDNGYPANVYIGGQYVRTEGTYQRQNTLSRAQYSAYSYQQNGLVIERAHFDWKPTDWFGFRAGRYLTPFGIWNEDHGSPVVLGVNMPTIINYGIVPTQQMGIEVYGNRLLTDDLNLEYAATLSNGRGPTDVTKDLDSNKALGLRGKLVYSKDDLLLRLGGYGYYGKYTDRDNEANVYLTPALTLDRTQPVPFGGISKVTNSYRETIGTLDAMVQYKGLKVMAEYARRKVVYDVAPLMDPRGGLLFNVPYGTTIHAAGYTGIAYYVLGGYEFDLGDSLSNIKVTPYAGYDHLAPDQTQPWYNSDIYRFGLNVKPSPYVTAKLEAERHIPMEDVFASKNWTLLAQTAVSF